MAINKYEIRIFAMQRSGQHALVEWLCDHFHGPVYFRNNILVGRSPARIMYRNVSAEVAKKDQEGELCNKDCFIFNVEDAPLLGIQKHLKVLQELPWGQSNAIFNVLLIRDVYNLMASRIQSVKNSGKKCSRSQIDVAIHRWIDHANEYLGGTNYLNDAIKINYNRWCIDQQYRRGVSSRLKLKFVDTGFNRVSSFGRGSSFDGLKYNCQASKMKVLERWKQVNDAEFSRVFGHPVLKTLVEKIFGNVLSCESAK